MITGKIEKLERHIRVENGYEISCPPDESEIIEKINLLIDAVNELKSGSKNVQKQSKSGSGNVALDWIKGAKNE